jgi:hypothetical protein
MNGALRNTLLDLKNLNKKGFDSSTTRVVCLSLLIRTYGGNAV